VSHTLAGVGGLGYGDRNSVGVASHEAREVGQRDMAESGPNAPAGWYPDADGRQRYWDGSAWLDLPAPPPLADAEDPETVEVQNRPARRRTWIIASIAAAVLVLGGAGVAAWKVTTDARAAAEQQAAEESAERRAAAAAERAAAEDAAKRAEAEEAERALRAAAVEDVEASITKMAKEHVKDDLIDGPVLDVSCSPVDGGSTDDLTEKTTVFECFVVNKKNRDGTMNGYYYNATMNWDTGSYTYGYGRP